MNGNSSASYQPGSLKDVHQARGIINLLLALVTSTSNGLVLIVFAKDPNRDIRSSPINLMITSLALVDFIVGVVLEPLGSYWHLSAAKDGKWPFESKYLQTAEAFLLLVSVFHFVAISIERYSAVLHPLHHGRRVGRKSAYICTVAMWGYCATFIGCLQLLGKAFIRNIVYCVHVDIGLCVLVIFFSLAVRQMRVRTKRFTSYSTGKCLAQRLQERERKVTRKFLEIIGVFFLCCFPWSLLIQIYPLCRICQTNKTIITWIFKMFFVLFQANCACNPFLCALRLPRYRKGLRKLYSCRPSRQLHSLTDGKEIKVVFQRSSYLGN